MYLTFDCGDKNYRCKMSTRALVDMERALGENPINIFVGMADNKMPKLEDLLIILFCSMQDLNHGIKKSDIYDIFDDYCENGGSIMSLTEFLANLLSESGIMGKPEDEKKEEAEGEERKN